jgi:hypothetical protein
MPVYFSCMNCTAVEGMLRITVVTDAPDYLSNFKTGCSSQIVPTLQVPWRVESTLSLGSVRMQLNS